MKFGFSPSAEKNGLPRIEKLVPSAAIPGGEIAILGSGFASRSGPRPIVRFGEVDAGIALAAENRLLVRVPENARGGLLRVINGEHESAPFPVSVGLQIADN